MSVYLKIYLIIFAVAFVFFFPRLCFCLFGNKKRSRVYNSVQDDLAVLIPVVGEANNVLKLLASLQAQTYNKKHFDCFVIVGNENHPAVATARQMGANIMVVNNLKSQGQALDVCLKSILREHKGQYFASIVLDANSVLAPDFLAEMNNAVALNTQIVIPKKLVKCLISNKKATSKRSREVYTYNDLVNANDAIRDVQGMSPKVCGSGMMLRMDLIESLGGWPYTEIPNNGELRMACRLKNCSAKYYCYAEIVVGKVTSSNAFAWLSKLYKRSHYSLKKVAKIQRNGARRSKAFLYGSVSMYVIEIASLIALLSGLFLDINMVWWALGIFLLTWMTCFVFSLIANRKNRSRLPWFGWLALLFRNPFRVRLTV